MFAAMAWSGAALAVAMIVTGASTSASTSAAPPQQSDAQPIGRAAANIAATEAAHRAWITLDLATAKLQSAAVAAAPTGSPLHRLDGLVVAVKDNIDTSWLPTTAGARILRNRRPARNATVVERILAAGGVIPGKTNMDTWARGVRTTSELVGATRNAIDPSKSAGGSSGGTAVAIALGHADVGVGTDTCGSLRYPAAYNGIYGLRTTPGLVSRSGTVPLSPTHDVIGPMARTPEHLGLLLDVMAGRDDLDPLTHSAPKQSYVDITSQTNVPVRIGVLHERGTFRNAATGRSPLTLLRAAGAELVDVRLPALALPNVINEEFAVLQPRIVDGTLNEQSWIAADMDINTRTYRTKIAQMGKDRAGLIAFLDANRLDALVYPTTPFLAAPVGRSQPSANCSIAAGTGTPALSIPHPDAPVPGVDILGRPFSEPLLLRIAAGYETERRKSR